jgi:hypothetical protein
VNESYRDNESRLEGEGERWERAEPLYYAWLGQPVVINYARGPSWVALEDPYEAAKGPVEAREALFLLEQAGSVGVGVRRILRDDDDREQLGILLFIPWGAIHAMYSAIADDLDDEQQVEPSQPQAGDESQA